MTTPMRETFESTQAPDSLEKFQGGYANPSVNREWEVWKRAWESCRQSELPVPLGVNHDPALTPHELEFVKSLFSTHPDSQTHLK
ncbi:hypothetical protein [Pseudomonas fluorescens]|uniref:hypothetical protein n=1 Tax=Pseudomonas fluorescens TaxID=294 RepID=UPI003CFD1B01